jgi:WhiB family redox-sensing transcriptional regulator
MRVRAEDTRNGVWRLLAACDPLTGIARAAGRFIPHGFLSESLDRQREAALFCHSVCPVRLECLAFAMETGDENYVYGGTTETERRHLLLKERMTRSASELWPSSGGTAQANVL